MPQHPQIHPKANSLEGFAVKFVVNQIDFENKMVARATFLIGDSKVDSVITESMIGDAPGTRGLSIQEDCIGLILSVCGLWKTFGQDFWALRDGHGRPLPWDYGNIPHEFVQSVDRSIRKHDSTIA